MKDCIAATDYVDSLHNVSWQQHNSLVIWHLPTHLSITNPTC